MTLRRLAAALAATALGLLVAAEFSTVYEVTVGSLEIVKRSSTAGANHGYALLVVALFGAALALVGLRGAARAAGLSLVVLGAVAVFVALAVDRPATRAEGRLPESLAYENAQARAGAGLGLELAGGALLMVAGGLLAAAGAAGPAGAGRGGAAGRRERGAA